MNNRDVMQLIIQLSKQYYPNGPGGNLTPQSELLRQGFVRGTSLIYDLLVFKNPDNLDLKLSMVDVTNMNNQQQEG